MNHSVCINYFKENSGCSLQFQYKIFNGARCAWGEIFVKITNIDIK